MARPAAWRWSKSRTCGLLGGRFGLRIGRAGRRASNAALPLGSSKQTGSERIDYDPVYEGRSPWQLLPSIDHPIDPARCLVTGTGLTHLGSAKNRQAMHAAAASEMNDSMKMFTWGVEGGRPAPAASASRRNGSTRALDRSCARRANRSTCRRTRKTAARRRKSPEFTSSPPTERRDGSAWRSATSSPTTSSKSGTT